MNEEIMLLKKSLDGIELSEDEVRFVKWICGWDVWTVHQLTQLIKKCRISGN